MFPGNGLKRMVSVKDCNLNTMWNHQDPLRSSCLQRKAQDHRPWLCSPSMTSRSSSPHPQWPPSALHYTPDVRDDPVHPVKAQDHCSPQTHVLPICLLHQSSPSSSWTSSRPPIHWTLQLLPIHRLVSAFILHFNQRQCHVPSFWTLPRKHPELHRLPPPLSTYLSKPQPLDEPNHPSPSCLHPDGKHRWRA